MPISAGELQGARTGLITRVAGALGGALSSLAASLADTPVYFWVYVGVVLYVTRKLTFRQGFGRKRCVIGGRTVYLTAAEDDMTQNVIDTSKIDVSFADIGGLDDVKQALTEHVAWPFKRPDLFSGKTVRSHPKGILLYGPPGTGKTMLARALAKELGCSFINVNTESIFSKWVGDTEKNSAAVFTLAEKLSPCVIFVDEIDSLLSSRNEHDVTPHTHAKTIFMTHWDGLEKNTEARIIVVGATNRRFIIDDAVRRRMPLQLEVPPPDAKARATILQIVLEHDLQGNPHKDGLIQYVANKTTNYTGSDLTELCKAAALIQIREIGVSGDPSADAEAVIPHLTQHHFEEAMKRVKVSK